MQYAWKYIEEESWLPWLRFTWQNVTLQINYEVSFFLANFKLYMVSNIYLVLFWKLHSRKTPKIMITMTFTVNICYSFQKGVPIFFFPQFNSLGLCFESFDLFTGYQRTPHKIKGKAQRKNLEHSFINNIFSCDATNF